MRREKKDIPGRPYSMFNDTRQTNVSRKWSSSECRRVHCKWVSGSE